RTVLKASRANAALQALTIAYPNLAGVGLPIVAAVIGPGGTVPIAVALAAGSILITPLSLILVEVDTATSSGATGTSWSRISKAFGKALSRPVVLAPAL